MTKVLYTWSYPSTSLSISDSIPPQAVWIVEIQHLVTIRESHVLFMAWLGLAPRRTQIVYATPLMLERGEDFY